MELKYKLKVDARKFFDDKMSKEVMTLKRWNDEGIPIQILDEVPCVHVTYGHEKVSQSGLRTADLAGWRSDGNQAHFHFTVWVDEITSHEYDVIKIEKVLDKIQDVLNSHFKNR